MRRDVKASIETHIGRPLGALREAALWAALALAVLWWLPSIVLALLDVGTFYVRNKLVLWVVARLMDVGAVGSAERLLERSRRRVQRYGRARGW